MSYLSFAGRKFVPPGPVAAKFMADRKSVVRALMGPQGGGKTVTCIHDHLQNAALMPVCKDGIIRYRVAIIRDTYARLEETMIKTWLEWVPKELGEWQGGGGRVAKHNLQFTVLRDGEEIPIKFEAIFAAIGDQAAEDFMRGFEVTAFHFNEMDLLVEDVLTYALGRIGRYPRRQDVHGGKYRSYIVGDLNAPDVDSWFYRRFEEERPAGFALYRQPSGLSPKAENRQNLPERYYEDQVELNKSKPNWIRRFVHAEYGPSEEGQPVYPEYSDKIHYADHDLPALKDRPLLLGFDQGLTRPACVIFQRASNGQWRGLAELVPGRMNARRFAQAVAQLAHEIAPGVEIKCAWADPAGFTGADKEAGELAWAETVSHELGIPVLPAPSNEIDLRLSAVQEELTYMIDAHTPALILSRRMKMLRKGFASHYRYRKQRVGNTERYEDRPDKTNGYSDIHDALQYLLLGEKGRNGVVYREKDGFLIKKRLKNKAVSHVIKSDYISGMF